MRPLLPPLRPIFKYERLCWRHALKETRGAFGEHRKAVVRILALAIVSVAIVAWIKSESVWLAAGGGALALLAGVAAVLFVNLIAAPSEVDAELRSQLREQSSEEEIEGRRNMFAAKLVTLMDEAGELIEAIPGGKVGNEDMILLRLEEWSTKLREVCESFGLQWEWRIICDPVTVRKGHRDFTGLIVQVVERRADRLRNLLSRCSQGSSDPIRPPRTIVAVET